MQAGWPSGGAFTPFDAQGVAVLDMHMLNCLKQIASDLQV
jgi:hypothetical protein